MRLWTGFSHPWRGPLACFCDRDNGPSGSIKDGQFLDRLSDYHLIKKDSCPWDVVFCFHLYAISVDHEILRVWELLKTSSVVMVANRILMYIHRMHIAQFCFSMLFILGLFVFCNPLIEYLVQW
jgi:hypothetical protein